MYTTLKVKGKNFVNKTAYVESNLSGVYEKLIVLPAKEYGLTSIFSRKF